MLFFFVGFIPNLHVQKINLVLDSWVYTKFACPETKLFLEIVFYTKLACPENKFVLGMFVLYQICMSSAPIYFWNVGFIQNVHVQKTNLCFGIFGFIPNLHVHKHNCFGKFGFIQHMHAHKTILLLDVWVYNKFTCPEYRLFLLECWFYI